VAAILGRRAATDMAGVGVISTSTNGRALQSSSWRATTDATLINEIPLRDDA